MGQDIIIVDKDGRGDFTYIQDAIDSVPIDNKGVMIVVLEGTYYEKLVINKPNITLLGEPKKNVDIMFDDYKKEGFTGGAVSTMATLRVVAPGFSAENLIFVNMGINEPTAEQAVCCYISADRVQFHHCGFLGKGDSMIIAPLPLQVIDRSAEGQLAGLGRQYFRACYIEGDLSMVPGSAVAVFDYSKMQRLPRHTERGGVGGHEFGYVFRNSFFTGRIEPEILENASKVALIECKIEGKELTVKDAERYTLDQVFVDSSWCCVTPEYEAKMSSRAS